MTVSVPTPMPTPTPTQAYPPTLVAFIILEIAGLLLLVFSTFVVIVQLKPFVTKRTLLQYFLAAIVDRLIKIPGNLVHGVHPERLGMFCTIQGYLSSLLRFPIETTPVVLALYLWFAVARNRSVEDKLYWTFTFIIWTLALVETFVLLCISVDASDFRMEGGMGSCKPLETRTQSREIFFLNMPPLIFALFGVGLSVASMCSLFSIWRRQVERTVIRYWYGVTLVLACLLTAIMQGITDMQSIVILGSEVNEISEVHGFYIMFEMSTFGRQIIPPILYTAFTLLQSDFLAVPQRESKLLDDEDDWSSSFELI